MTTEPARAGGRGGAGAETAGGLARAWSRLASSLGETGPILGLVLLAALLRAWHLDRMSIWQDEGLSLHRAALDLPTLLSGRIMLGAFPTQDVQPPLYFLLLAGWFKLLGAGTWAAKWLSLLASLPSVPLLWALGRRWVGPGAARLAATLAALSPVYLWYSQEIRSYSLAVSLGLGAVYCLARALAPDATGRARLAWLGGSGALNVALIWTHYLGLFLVLFEVAWLLLVAARRRRREALALLALLALASLPLLPFAIARLGAGKERDQFFHPPQDWLLTMLGSYGMGRTMPAWLVPVGMLLFGVLLLTGAAWLWRRRRASLWLLLGYLLVPTAAFFALTLLKPAFRGVQHLLLQSPPFYLLVAVGLWATWRRRRAAGAAAALVVLALMAVADRAYYTDTAFAKDDLRGVAEHVDARALPGDILAVSDPVLALAFQALGPRAELRVLPPLGADGLPLARPPEELLAPLLAGRRRLWLVNPDERLAAWLDRRALKVAEAGFHATDMVLDLAAYERRPSDPADLPPRFGLEALLDAVKPLGFEVLPAPLRAGEPARVRLAWQLYREPAPDYQLSLRLLDAAGRVFGQSDAPLPASTWPYGEVTYWPQDLVVSPGAAPGRYRLAATLYDQASGQAWPEGEPLVLGEVEVAPPRQPLASSEVAVGRRLWAAGGGLRLFGFDLPASAGMAGERLPLALWLQAGAERPAVAALRAELVDGLGRVATAAEAAVAAPEAPLAAGDLRRLPVELRLPADAGRYGLRVRAVDAEGRTLWLRRGALPVRAVALGVVDVRAPERSTAVPAMARRLDAPVGDSARLLGYDLPVSTVHPGSELPVTLFWRSEQRTPDSYRVTVQLVPVAAGSGEPSGPPVAQHDGLPVDGTRPTSGWAPAEVLTDGHRIPLPADLPPGDYLLIAALYDPARPGAPRPPVEQGGARRDYAVLQSVTVLAGTASPAP